MRSERSSAANGLNTFDSGHKFTELRIVFFLAYVSSIVADDFREKHHPLFVHGPWSRLFLYVSLAQLNYK